MNVPNASYEIIYNGKNITGDIVRYALSFNYTDKAAGESDEIEIVLEDSDGLWKMDWYPTKGDTINARIFDLGNVLECGLFTVDEITASGSVSGDTVAIKGIATGINKKVRTKESFAHENKTLREIANTIASKHALTVEGTISDIKIKRVTQYRETDLGFLQRLASDYGYTFSVRGSKLIFTNVFEIENKTSALIIARAEVISYSFTDKTSKTFKSAKVSYHNPAQKKVVTFEQTEQTEAFKTAKSDSLQLRVKADNQQQAEIKARVALYGANSLQQEGSLDIPGNVLALAGNNCELEFFGMFSGRFYIQSSSHSVTKDSGYSTSLEIKRVGLVERNKQKK